MAAGKFDRLPGRAVRANDLNGSTRIEAAECLIGDAPSGLDEVRRTHRRERVRGEPLRPPAGPILIVEIAA